MKKILLNTLVGSVASTFLIILFYYTGALVEEVMFKPKYENPSVLDNFINTVGNGFLAWGLVVSGIMVCHLIGVGVMELFGRKKVD